MSDELPIISAETFVHATERAVAKGYCKIRILKYDGKDADVITGAIYEDDNGLQAEWFKP